ncbi:hypothetical protein TUBRATIS_24220 [Tubulinosema ratisbonensis]|uniref:Uncharacterized protein n=1 Tax=Tubulinosema ratisbonensis TaxID=291195 RepID=A0A437AJ54_9MICR|nr:hypothetical protein TUBRATIS_24220 [Tubulinosema ratisbonensis]
MFVFILFFYKLCFSTINPQQVNQHLNKLSKEPTYIKNNYRELKLCVSLYIKECRNLIYEIILKNDFGKLQNDDLRTLESNFVYFTENKIYNILENNSQLSPFEIWKIIVDEWYDHYFLITLYSSYYDRKLRSFFYEFFQELEALFTK